MQEIIQLLLANYTALCLMIGLGFIVIMNRNLDKRTNTYFIIYILFMVLLCFAEILDVYLANMSSPTILRYFTSAIGYTLRPTCIAVMIMILLRKKNGGVFLWIPIIIYSGSVVKTKI